MDETCFLQDGYSPLFTASIKGHSEVVKTLLNAGANVNKGDVVGTVYLGGCPGEKIQMRYNA